MKSSSQPPALPRTPSFLFLSIQRTIGLVRFLAFIGVLAAIAIYLIPSEYLTLTYQTLIGGTLILAFLFGTIWFLLRPKKTIDGIKPPVNIEATAAVVIGMVIIIIASVALLLSGIAPEIAILGVIPLGIYTYYIYRIVKDALTITYENEVVRKRYGALLEVNREKSNFITVTSHQLRTPLSELRWALEQILREKETTENARLMGQKMMESIKWLVALVDDMQNIKTLEHHAKEAAQAFTETIDPLMLIQETVGELNALAAEKGVAVSLHPSEQTLAVRGEKEELKRIFRAIIDNAIRYSPKGTINISFNKEQNVMKVRVEDTGIGIALEDQNRVFQKFFRGKNALLAEPNGSGLGLFNAKQIAEKYGGTITFFSRQEGGTIFIVTLPLA